MRITKLFSLLAAVALPLSMDGQTLTITNGLRTYPGITNTIVTVSGRSELHVTASSNPIPGTLVNLTSPDAWFFLPNIAPSTVVSSYMPQIRVNGAVATADSNCRVVQYGQGAVVIPHAASFQPLEVFSGSHFTGNSTSLGQHVYYRGAQLGALNANISSFKLKRGYTATLAQNENGSGISRNYVAQDGDMEVSVLPGDLDNRVRFIYVVPWRWVSKKGSSDEEPAPLDAAWHYNWSIDKNSTRDWEYVAIKQQPFWPGLNQDWRTRGVNHLLGFNEPNNPVEDAYENLSPPGSVDDAVARWPELLGTGLRVGAPAVTDGGQGWITDFMNQADAAGMRVDYVPIHYYRSYWNNNDQAGAANQLYNFLKGIYDTVKRPLWVTEFNNGANWTDNAHDPNVTQNRNVIEAMINMMDDTPWIERYAIYSDVEWFRRTHYDDGSLTPMGTMYRDHVAPLAYLQGLQDNGTRGFSQLHLDGDSLDSSGHGNNGLISSAPTYTNGHSGQGLVFDGTNTKVTLPPNIANNNAFTFAAWVNWKGGGNWQRIFDFGNSVTHYMFLTPSSGSSTLRFAIRNGGGEQTVQAGFPLPQNQWLHVAVTHNGNTARLYVNGTQVGVNSSMSITPANFDPRVNFLGDSQFIADPLFNGMMDEVLITDYALGSDQIAAQQTNKPPQFTTNFIAGGGAVPGEPYSFNLAGMATDSDAGDTLEFRKATGPDWLTVGLDGSLSGTPAGTDAGTNHFTIRATDPAGMNAFVVLEIAVESPLSGGPELVARYPFETNPTDASGNAFHGTASGSPGHVTGQYGLALDLDGANDFVTLPAGMFASISNFTIAAWVNWDGGGNWQRIFDFGNGTSQNLFLTPSSGSGTLRFAIKNGGSEQLVETAALPVGQWRYIAVTRDGNVCRLYVNGAQAAISGSVTISPASFNPSLNYLGKSQYPDPLFNGRLDEVFIYNYALSNVEITRLMSNLPPPPAEPTTVSLVVTDDTLDLSWPTNYLGSRLESNSVSLTATGEWFTVGGSATTNQMSLPVDGSQSNIFYRLVYP